MNKEVTKSKLKTLFELFNKKVEKATETARKRYKKLIEKKPKKTMEETPLAKDIPPPHKGGAKDRGDRDFL